MRRKAVFLAILSFLVLVPAGCAEQMFMPASARDILEQSAQAMEGVAGCTLTARLEMMMSVYGEETDITVDSRTELSLTEEKAGQTVEVRKAGESVSRTGHSYEGAEELKEFTAALDVKRFLKNAEFLSLVEGEDSEIIYELEGIVKANSLDRTEDLEAMASLLPVLEQDFWDSCKEGTSFSVRLRVDKESFLLQEVTVDITEAVQGVLAESAEVLGIPREEIEIGGCVATICLEDVTAAESEAQ